MRLERDSVRDLVERSASSHVSVAELYHENSKLFPAKLAELASSELDVGGFRREFVRRRTATRRDVPPRACDHPVRMLLSSVAREADAELFYALDLRLVIDGAVLLHEPGLDTLIEYAHADLGADEPLLCIVASLARNELLFGARGYRHSLLEAGRLAQHIAAAAKRAGLVASLSYDFDDWHVNDALEADGVEEAALVTVEFEEVRSDDEG